MPPNTGCPCHTIYNLNIVTFFQVLLSVLFFLLVLSTAVISKASLLFITSNVKRDNDFICEINSQGAILKCYRFPYGIAFPNATNFTTVPPLTTSADPGSGEFNTIQNEADGIGSVISLDEGSVDFDLLARSMQELGVTFGNNIKDYVLQYPSILQTIEYK